MQYIFKNKFFTLGGSSKINDLDGNPHFIVKGRLFTFTKKKILKDMDGNTLFVIRNRFINILLPKVYIYDNKGNKLCTFKKEKIFSFKNNFVLESDKINCKMQGNFIGLDGEILIDDQVAARTTKQFTLIADSYVVDVINEEYTNFIIALVVALDNFRDKVSDDRI